MTPPKIMPTLTVRDAARARCLCVADPDATAQRAIDAGAVSILPVQNQPYGLRQGRVSDPSGQYPALDGGLTGGGIESSPAVANGVVYVGSLDGKLYAWDLNADAPAAPATRPDISRLHPDPRIRVQRH